MRASSIRFRISQITSLKTAEWLITVQNLQLNPQRASQSEEREEEDLIDEPPECDDVFVAAAAANNNSTSVVSNENNNVISDREPPHPEKTTEGVLKAARLGDLNMLTELHQVIYYLY